MELLEAVKGRRSVRKYSDESVPEEIIVELIENSSWAPSAMNRQPWFFTIIRSEEMLGELRAIMAESSELEKEKLQNTFPNHPQVVKDTRTFMETLGGASTCILAFLPKDYGDQTLSMVESLSAAIQTFCLLAYEKGISTCWMTNHLKLEDKICARFGTGKGRCIAMITVGYGVQVPNPPRRHSSICEFI